MDFGRSLFAATIALAVWTRPADAKQSISELPTISKLLIHHFECTALLVLDGNSKEEKFSFAPVGGQRPQAGATVAIGGDRLEATGNAQMLSLDWKRANKFVASGMAMIKKSPTEAFNLILADPSNDGNQASVMCIAMTFADLGPAVKP